MALFTPAYNPQAWLPATPYERGMKNRQLPDVSPAEQAEIGRHNSAVDRRLSELRRRKGTLRDKGLARALDVEITRTESTRRGWGMFQALYDVGPPPRTRLLIRGGEETPGAEVAPGFLRALCRSEAEALAKPAAPHPGTSGRRTALARWLTDPGSPAAGLLARVLVNRVWKQLYGQGIVPTTDNFGAQGQPPTHPELLDWLARGFIEGGWRIKPLIRLMTVSTAYRQSSHERHLRDGGAGPATVDPGNELLWRQRLRRLESEVVRDSILGVSGDLSRAMGGPPVPTRARPDGHVVVALDQLNRPSEQYRRSVYLVARRSYNLSLLTAFDQPLVATNCLRRASSAVPLQSLFMLHDALLADQAEHFAGRVERLAPATPSRRIEAAFRVALARRPNAREAEVCAGLLRRQAAAYFAAGEPREGAAHRALAQLCLVLLNTSEFLFVE
jgi:hypothetical protein